MKNRYYHKYILALLMSSLLSLSAIAQNYNKHEFSVYGGGGLNTFRYSDVASQFDTKSKVGAQFGLNYTYSFNTNWGILSGAEMAFYSAKVETDNYTDAFNTKDVDDTPFEFRIKGGGNLENKQNAVFINIPVMVRYQTTGELKFYAAAGGKIGIPVKADSKLGISAITTTAYYPDDNIEYTDKPFMGIGTFNNLSEKKKMKLKTSIMLSIELGAKYAITKSNDLYAGIYFDYGLNDINNSKDAGRLIEYNPQLAQGFELNNSIASVITDNDKAIKVIDKVAPMAIGIKIGVSFAL